MFDGMMPDMPEDKPAAASLCEDEGCPHYGTAHVCINKEFDRIFGTFEDREVTLDRVVPTEEQMEDAWKWIVCAYENTTGRREEVKQMIAEALILLTRAEEYRKRSEDETIILSVRGEKKSF